MIADIRLAILSAAAMLFTSCGEAPQMSPRQASRGLPNSSSGVGADGTGASFVCNEANCPQVSVDFVGEGSPRVGESSDYRIKIRSSQDPTRKFLFWVVNGDIGVSPGPSAIDSQTMSLIGFRANSQQTRVTLKVRDLTRCEVKKMSNCESISASLPGDSQKDHIITASGGGGSDGSGSDDAERNAEIMEACQEKYDRETSGGSGGGFIGALPGIISGVGGIIGGDTTGGIKDVIGGIGGAFGGGGKPPRPSTLAECKSYLGL